MSFPRFSPKWSRIAPRNEKSPAKVDGNHFGSGGLIRASNPAGDEWTNMSNMGLVIDCLECPAHMCSRPFEQQVASGKYIRSIDLRYCSFIVSLSGPHHLPTS